MKKTKWIWRIVAGVVALVVLAVLGAWLMIDRLARQAVQQGGEYALGVPTTVETLDLSLLGGSLQMNTLNVANPAGYGSAHLVRTGRFQLAVEPGSVMTDTVRIPTFELEGLDLNIEVKGLKSNIAEVLEHIKKLGSDSKPAQDGGSSQQGGGKKVQVSRIVIRDVVAHVLLSIPATQPLTVKVPTIELNRVSSDKPVDVAELIGQLMPAIIAAVLEQGNGIIPADLLAGLQANVAGTVAALGGEAAQLLKQTSATVSRQVGDTLQQVSKAVPAAAQGVVGEATQQAQGALQNAQQAATGSLEQLTKGAAASQPAGSSGKKGLGKSLEGLIIKPGK